MKKKFTLFLFCGLLCTANLNAQTWQIGYPNAADVTATLQDSTLTISGIGAMMDWDNWAVNPPWRRLDEDIHRSVSTIIIENGVTTIGMRAFSWMFPVTSVTIPNSVTSIGGWAFSGCGRLTSVNISNNITSIGESAFANTGLASVTIPSTVTTIGFGAFADCRNLTSIEVDVNNPNYSSRDGVLFNRHQTILMQYPAGKQGEYVIPNSVWTISHNAFVGAIGLTSVTIPNSVTFIGNNAFLGCGVLTSVTIPNSVTTIGSNAFGRGASEVGTVLSNLIIEDGTSILNLSAGEWVIDTLYLGRNINWTVNVFGTSIEHLTIGNNVTTIGSMAFANNRQLTSVIIGSNVEAIGPNAFMNCTALRSVISLNPVPPTTIVGNPFPADARNFGTLYVISDEALALYQEANIWRDFLNIRVLQPSNIDVVNVETIQIFPNPVTHELHIINHDWQVNDVVELFDMNGRLVFSQSVGAKNLSPLQEFTIDMSPFNAGNYILRIGNRVAKVVKM